MSFAKLAPEPIVREAVAVMREGGLAQVSLRRIADRLGVAVSSIYWHIPDKAALYARMSHAIYADCVAGVGEVARWDEWLRAFADRLWHAQRDLPDIRALIVATEASGPPLPERSTLRAQVLDGLAARGLPRPTGQIALKATQALVTGWVTLAVSDEGEEHAQFRRALDHMLVGFRPSPVGEPSRPAPDR